MAGAPLAGKASMPAEQLSVEQQIQQLSPTDPIADWLRYQSAFIGRGQPGYNGGNRGSSLPVNLPVNLPVSVPVSPPVSLPFGSFASLPVLAGLPAPEQSARDDELFSAPRLSGGSLGGDAFSPESNSLIETSWSEAKAPYSMLSHTDGRAPYTQSIEPLFFNNLSPANGKAGLGLASKLAPPTSSAHRAGTLRSRVEFALGQGMEPAREDVVRAPPASTWGPQGKLYPFRSDLGAGSPPHSVR